MAILNLKDYLNKDHGFVKTEDGSLVTKVPLEEWINSLDISKDQKVELCIRLATQAGEFAKSILTGMYGEEAPVLDVEAWQLIIHFFMFGLIEDVTGDSVNFGKEETNE